MKFSLKLILLRSLLKRNRRKTLPLLHIHKFHSEERSHNWTAKILKEVLQKELVDDEILIVSNREPYIHRKNGNSVEIQFPASGLVTALEPVMRACSGVWIAHGSGSADRETGDARSHICGPPRGP